MSSLSYSYFCAVALVAVSTYYAMTSFSKLARQRQYAKLARALIAFIGFGLFIFAGLRFAWSIQDPERRVWFVIPFVCLIPIFLLSGYFLRDYAETSKPRNGTGTHTAINSKRRISGVLLICVGLVIWVVGFLHPLSKNISLLGLAAELVSFILGANFLARKSK